MLGPSILAGSFQNVLKWFEKQICEFRSPGLLYDRMGGPTTLIGRGMESHLCFARPTKRLPSVSDMWEDSWLSVQSFLGSGPSPGPSQVFLGGFEIEWPGPRCVVRLVGLHNSLGLNISQPEVNSAIIVCVWFEVLLPICGHTFGPSLCLFCEQSVAQTSFVSNLSICVNDFSSCVSCVYRELLVWCAASSSPGKEAMTSQQKEKLQKVRACGGSLQLRESDPGFCRYEFNWIFLGLVNYIDVWTCSLGIGWFCYVLLEAIGWLWHSILHQPPVESWG